MISTRAGQIMAIAGSMAAAVIYLLFASALSEDDMVNLSYLWVPVAVTGALIWWRGGAPFKHAALFAIATALMLFAFFELVFPAL